jgi:hypothetical protein
MLFSSSFSPFGTSMGSLNTGNPLLQPEQQQLDCSLAQPKLQIALNNASAIYGKHYEFQIVYWHNNNNATTSPALDAVPEDQQIHLELKANDEEERDDWVQMLEKAILYAKHYVTTPSTPSNENVDPNENFRNNDDINHHDPVNTAEEMAVAKRQSEKQSLEQQQQQQQQQASSLLLQERRQKLEELVPIKRQRSYSQNPRDHQNLLIRAMRRFSIRRDTSVSGSSPSAQTHGMSMEQHPKRSPFRRLSVYLSSKLTSSSSHHPDGTRSQTSSPSNKKVPPISALPIKPESSSQISPSEAQRKNRRKSVIVMLQDALRGNSEAEMQPKPLSLVEQYYLEEERKERERKEAAKNALNNDRNLNGLIDPIDSLDTLHLLIAEADEDERRKSVKKEAYSSESHNGENGNTNNIDNSDNNNHDNVSKTDKDTNDNVSNEKACGKIDQNEDLSLSEDEDSAKQRFSRGTSTTDGPVNKLSHVDDEDAVSDSDSVSDLSEDGEEEQPRLENEKSTIGKLLSLRNKARTDTTDICCNNGLSLTASSEQMVE